MPKYNQIFLGFGSNIGDRSRNLKKALSLLEIDPQIKIISSSSIYETEPMYVKIQPKFLNRVAEIETEFGPDDLLGVCIEIETKLGRIRKNKKDILRCPNLGMPFRPPMRFQ